VSTASTATWIAAARLRTLPAAVVPVVVGTACAAASGRVAWGPALAALGGALAIQIGTNFANDVFDAERVGWGVSQRCMAIARTAFMGSA